VIKNLAFIKIHKCSSTSVRNIIERFADKNSLSYIYKGLRLGCKFRGQAWTVKPKKQYNISTRHIAYDRRFFEAIIDRPVFISFVRDPLSRALSHYYSLTRKKLRHPKVHFDQWYGHNNKRHAKSPTDPMFFYRNYMSYFLGYDSIDEITIDSLNDRYIFIGVTERFNESIFLMQKTLGWNLQHPSKYRRYNVRKNKAKLPPVSPKIKKIFMRNNKLDYKLYQLVNVILQNKLNV